MKVTKQIVAMSGLVAAGAAAPMANVFAPDYQCFYGGAGNFPDQSRWVSLETMRENANYALHTGCIKGEPQNNDWQIDTMMNSIRQVGQESGVDPRFIFAIVMQESNGCVNVVGTTNPDPNGPFNPGLMQSHSGVSFIGNWATPEQQAQSITQMIRDGTTGTSSGGGLLQCLQRHGNNVYEAARCYNSGEWGVTREDLNNGGVATRSYVNDVANRFLGWVWSNPGFEKC